MIKQFSLILFLLKSAPSILLIFQYVILQSFRNFVYNFIHLKKFAKVLFNKHALINGASARGNSIEVRISSTKRFGLFWVDNGKIAWKDAHNCCAIFYNVNVISISCFIICVHYEPAQHFVEDCKLFYCYRNFTSIIKCPEPLYLGFLT